MKGEWVYDDQRDVWHLITQTDSNEPMFGTWCRKWYTTEAFRKSGGQITWADTVHDECARKSEELP